MNCLLPKKGQKKGSITLHLEWRICCFVFFLLYVSRRLSDKLSVSSFEYFAVGLMMLAFSLPICIVLIGDVFVKLSDAFVF